jgi:predicted negative regulator of RcsB-dependent stress response
LIVVRSIFVSDHLSRKELKQDRIHDALEHSAEAVYTHKQTSIIVLSVVLIVAAAYGGWSVYHERQTASASAQFDIAMKAYSGHIGSSPDPAEAGEPSYADEAARSNDALAKFTVVADKYPSTSPGRLARYYAALCLEDLDKENQALEELKKISNGSDKELASMAQYQTAVLYSRTGKADEAAKIYRALADKPSVFVTRPLALLELAGVLRQNNPKEAAGVYQQVKKEYPESAISEEADRGLDTLGPKS